MGEEWLYCFAVKYAGGWLEFFRQPPVAPPFRISLLNLGMAVKRVIHNAPAAEVEAASDTKDVGDTILVVRTVHVLLLSLARALLRARPRLSPARLKVAVILAGAVPLALPAPPALGDRNPCRTGALLELLAAAAALAFSHLLFSLLP